MNRLLVSNLVFPLHEALKGHQSVRLHHALMVSQWQSWRQLQQAQQYKLYTLLYALVDQVPFYADYAPMLPKYPQEAFESLSQWPLMTKAHITQHFQNLKSSNAKSLILRQTGGSSGEPFRFMMGRQRISHDVAAKWRATRWWGVDLGDKELVIWGSPIEKNSQGLIKNVRDQLLRTMFFSAHGLDEAKAISIIETIQKFKPKMLFSYPSILSHIAQIALKHHISSGFDSIKVAFVTSEMLEPFQRTLITKVFGCPVANGYGAREAGFIAHACPQGSMHISCEDILVEIVDEQGNILPANSVGEIVVTHLSTSDFPFIRYRTGDYGSLSDKPCACGRGLPVLEKLEGRLSDLIYSQQGGVVHRNEIIQVVSSVSSIQQFRFEQMSLGCSVLVYKGIILSKEERSNIVVQFKSLLGSQVDIQIKQVAIMPSCASGKHRFVISHLAKNQAMAHDDERISFVG